LPAIVCICLRTASGVTSTGTFAVAGFQASTGPAEIRCDAVKLFFAIPTVFEVLAWVADYSVVALNALMIDATYSIVCALFIVVATDGAKSPGSLLGSIVTVEAIWTNIVSTLAIVPAEFAFEWVVGIRTAIAAALKVSFNADIFSEHAASPSPNNPTCSPDIPIIHL